MAENASLVLDRGARYCSCCLHDVHLSTLPSVPYPNLQETWDRVPSVTYPNLQETWDRVLRVKDGAVDRAVLARQRATAHMVHVKNQTLRRRLRGYRVLL